MHKTQTSQRSLEVEIKRSVSLCTSSWYTKPQTWHTTTKPGCLSTTKCVMDWWVFDICQLTSYQFVPSKAEKSFSVFDPANDEKICDVYEAREEDVNVAVDAAQTAFADWSSRNANERAACLMRLSQLITLHAQELSELEGQTMGKSVLLNGK